MNPSQKAKEFMSKLFLKPKGQMQRPVQRLLLVAYLSIGSAAFIGSTPAFGQAPAAAVDVKLVQPRKGDVARNITLPASVVANQQVTLYSKATGYLKTITVDKGDKVKKGDLIAEIEAPELLADIAKCQAELEIAELDYKRVVDAQKKAPDLIVAQLIDTARSKVAMAKANLQRAETLLSFCKITAPFPGVVTKRYVDPGAFVPAASAGSSPQSAALVTLVDFETVRVQIPVPEAEATRVKTGLPVKVSVEGWAGKVFEGTITRSSEVLDELSKTMLAEVDIKNANGELRPGMYAIAKVAIEKHSDTVLLPVEAVLTEKAGASVFVVDSGKAKKIPVKLGFNDGTSVEVLEGLQPNTAVIIVGKTPPAVGQAVNVTETK
jgi:membrane fusion protein (multidrug efflux system)